MALPEYIGDPVLTRVLSPITGIQMQPIPVNLDGTNPTTVFDRSRTGKDRRPRRLVIRNINNVKVYWAKNTTASASVYHGILKAATASADGSGGEVDLSQDVPLTVSLFASAAALVVVDVIYEESV